MIRKQEYLFQHLTFLWCIDYFCATKERQGQELLPSHILRFLLTGTYKYIILNTHLFHYLG